MKRLLYSLLFLVTALTATANDGVYYTSGNHLVPLVETDISVKKEILTISLQDNGLAKVDVYYEFFNPGNKAKSVMMGFEADPPYNDGYEFYPSGVHPHIKNFTVEINGQRVPYKNAVCKANLTEMKNSVLNLAEYEYNAEYNRLQEKGSGDDADGVDFAYVYYFNVSFKPGINIIHHTYQYTTSMSVGTVFEVPYKLSPAGRWAGGTIGDFTLVIRADNTAKHFLITNAIFPGDQFVISEGTGKQRITTYYDVPYREFSIRNGAIKLHKTNFRPDPETELYIASADMIYTFNENAKYGSFYDRNSAFTYESWKMMGDHQPISAALAKRVTKNLPFAHRGHVFKDATLKKYFESLWWYMPDPSYKDDTSGFTKSDWIYVQEGK